jgi:hypothetical protein
VSGTYELPIGNDRHFLSHEGRVVNAFIGGWDTNGILTLQDGQPGTVPCAITTTSGFLCNADKVPGQNPDAGPHAGPNEALALPTLKRVIIVETLSRSAKAPLPPRKCGAPTTL